MSKCEQKPTPQSNDSKLAELDVIKYADVPANKVEDYIKTILDSYERTLPKRKLELVTGPFASVQERLFDKNKDIIVRALVRRKKRTNVKAE